MKISMQAIVSFAAIAFCLTPVDQAQAQTKVLKFATIQARGQPAYKGMERMAELVEQRSGGKLKLQLFADGQLGTEQQSAEGVQLGTIDMYMGSSGAVGRFLPSLEAFSSPYVWRDVDHMMKVVRGPIGEELNKELISKTGIRLLDMGWFFGARHIATRKFGVNTTNDLKGRKIRMQPTTIYIEMMRAMGANVISLDWKEVYTSMQTGVIDGFDCPANVLAARAMWEVLDHVTMSSHIMQNMVVIINEAAYQNLTPELQKVLANAARDAGDYQTTLTIKDDEDSIELLRKNKVTIIKPDLASFKASTANVHRQFESKWAANLYSRIVNTK